MFRPMHVYLLLVLSPLWAAGQHVLQLSGRVLDDLGQPMPGCHVHVDSLCSISDAEGMYGFRSLAPGTYTISASYMGFSTFSKQVLIGELPVSVDIVLMPSALELEEVVVTEDYLRSRKEATTSSIAVVQEDFLQKNRAGSMMKTLERMPGISTIEIGSAQSKPMIRGLGFNRVVVAESGIKHEGQQWGADHGLEIDQFNVEEAEVIKGPASLVYGSDAIGGVVQFRPYTVPVRTGITGSATFQTRSNNGLYGTSLQVKGRKKRMFFFGRATGLTYGDYRVPTNMVTYNTFTFDLPDNTLRNTAGRELNVFLSGGFESKHGKTKISLGNYFNRSGFFADVRGFEIRDSRIDYNASKRDIDLPYQQVNHLKVISNSVLYVGDNTLDLDFSFQKNYRQEFSEPTESGYQPLPPDSLERQFNKNIYSGNITYSWNPGPDHLLKAGVNTEFQHNRIGGWGFIIPAFERFTAGIFLFDKYAFSDRWFITGGARFDFGMLNIHSYSDWYPTPVFDASGNPVGEAYMERVLPMEKSFDNFSFSAGAGFISGNWLVKLNLGKSFRIPDARELATDGVNYHLFRQETGNPDMTAEEAWQVDGSLEFNAKKTRFSVSPFYTWFPNYIYLNPTSGFSDETGLQVFQYVQNEVVRWGGEVEFRQEFLTSFFAGGSAEYVYSEQRSGNKEGFGLAFTPPPSVVFNLTWEPTLQKDRFRNSYLSVDYKIAAKQNRIVPPEEVTDGYQVLNLSAGVDLILGNQLIQIYLQIHNLLNVRYYNHSSYYRLISIPEPGRNVQATVVLPFNFTRK